MPGQRKLFVAHASELAYRCVRAVQRDGLVAEFVRGYAGNYNRPGLSINPERNREFDSTIGREALLVMAAKVGRMLPAIFGHASGKSGRPGKARRENAPELRPQEVILSEAFYAEFLASLGRSLEWPPAEAAAESNAFFRDLEMYQSWTGHSNVQSDGHSTLSIADGIHSVNANDPRESPFADRCALLLDPAMMEQARRAASEFEVTISRAAARMFSQLGWRPAARRKPVRAAQPSRRSPKLTAQREPVRSSHPKKSRRSRKQSPRSPLRSKKKLGSAGRSKKSPRAGKLFPNSKGARDRKGSSGTDVKSRSKRGRESRVKKAIRK